MMTEQEKIEALQLTPEQNKAFKKMYKAFVECERLGIKFIGEEHAHYALNGHNLAGDRCYDFDGPEDDEIDFKKLQGGDCIFLTEPYINVGVYLKVKPKNK